MHNLAQDLIRFTEGTTTDLKALLKRKELGLSTNEGSKPYVGLGNGNALGLVTDNEMAAHQNHAMPHKFVIGSEVFNYGLALNPQLNCVSFIFEKEV